MDQAIGSVARILQMLSTSDHNSVVSMNLFVALLCACIVIGHLLEESRWMNESITALLIGVCSGVVILLTTGGKSSHLFVFSEDLFFIYLLPPIIFNAGFQVKKKQFFRNFITIMMFGAIGTLICCSIISLAIIAARWTRKQGRLVRQSEQNSEMANNNENTRVDQLEALMAQMAERMQESERIRLNSERMMLEQLQAMTAAMANLTTLRTMEAETSKKRDEENEIAEDIPLFDDDMAEYFASHRAKSRDEEEIQKLKEQVDTVTQKMKGKHEDLLDYNAMAFKEQLPQNFKMPEMAKFDGKGDPKTHIRQYVSLMSATGLSQNQVRKMFGMSLEGAPVVWYHNLEDKIKDDWRALAEAFLAHYVTDLDIDSSLRDLENVKQKPEESFKEYVDRWKAQLVRMQTRPSEKDQIMMIIKGIKPYIYNRMRRMTSVIADFKQLKEAVMDIEEEEAENRKGQGQNWKGNGIKDDPTEVKSVKNRRFSNFNRPLSKIFEKLKKEGLLEPLEPRPLPSPIPPYMDMNQFCYFHQQKGHHTDNCARLKHEIQNLIDAGKIPDPDRA